MSKEDPVLTGLRAEIESEANQKWLATAPLGLLRLNLEIAERILAETSPDDYRRPRIQLQADTLRQAIGKRVGPVVIGLKTLQLKGKVGSNG